MKVRKRRKKTGEMVDKLVGSKGAAKNGIIGGGMKGKGRGNERREKDEALKTLVKSGRGVTVVGKDVKRFGAQTNGKDKGKGAGDIQEAGSAKWKL